MLFIGLMSGTSLDGVDGVIAEFTSKDLKAGSASSSLSARTIAFASAEFHPHLRNELFALQSEQRDELNRAMVAANALAYVYAKVVESLLHKSGLKASAICAIGAHGQTIRHQPDSGYTVQLMNGALLAELTSISVVCDFRSGDIAAGGQGAPLAPSFHNEVFASSTEPRAIVNIGGIANVSLLMPGQAPLGFDTGPGNVLMDFWCHKHLDHAFDMSGDWASSGVINHDLLQRFLSEPYFALKAPKSTGRDLFNSHWLEQKLVGDSTVLSNQISPQDVQATLAELTAVTISRELAGFRSFIAGGGARNKFLMERISAQTQTSLQIESTAALGIDTQSLEALAFAWLASQRIHQLPGNLTSVTGAKRPKILGALYIN